MNRIALITMCLLSALSIICFWPQPAKTIYQIESPSSPLTTQEVLVVVPDILQHINASNGQIKSIQSQVTAKLNGRSFRLEGLLAYQKSKNFRLSLNSFLGQELDIGSNTNIFWFYVKRMKPSYLYYSRYEDIKNTRLKPLFHPIWLIESLGLNSLPYNTTLSKKGRYLELQDWRSDLSGEKVLHSTLIDPARPAVVGHYLFNERRILIASSEVESFQTYNGAYIPKTLKLIWSEESESLTLELNNISVNNTIPTTTWQMPRMKKMLDMGRQEH